MNSDRKNTAGKRFGRLVAICPTEKRQGYAIIWKCKCDCGNIAEVPCASLWRGHTRSCGCFYRERIKAGICWTHGHNSAKFGKSATYNSWSNMIQRCCNPKNTSYRKYGGQGIEVCERWKAFEKFLEDMGERPTGTTLERRDSSKGYNPSNCKWSTIFEQNANTARNVRITWNGETLIASEWARRLNVNKTTLMYRYRHGMWPK